ncbi:diacylglycerol/lipid kinase family protein [Aquipuribacter nitratireducens]|uniref:Diacylglycerol/lipid kinase family protein n=1 Tax=Aquipuribacter nitratireducens TaxID=650104 RepID=A0ABW0GNZ0_9MICO
MTTVAVVSAGKAEGAGRQVAEVERVLREHLGPADARVRVLERDDDLARALRSDASRVVVLGGDGSINKAVATLHQLGLTGVDAGPDLGLVPLGTGNDLARGSGIPLDVTEAARLAVTGRARARALLLEREDGGVVVNAVHAGVGAGAARTADEASGAKSVLGGLVYSAAAVAAGLRVRGWHLRVEADGAVVHDGHEPVLMVAAAVGHTIGGGAPLAPDAEPFEGVAQVTVSRSTGWLSRLGYAAALRAGRHHLRRDVTTAFAHRSVTVSAERGDRFRTDSDGEIAGPFAHRTWTVLAEAWRLVVPDDTNTPPA